MGQGKEMMVSDMGPGGKESPGHMTLIEFADALHMHRREKRRL